MRCSRCELEVGERYVGLGLPVEWVCFDCFERALEQAAALLDKLAELELAKEE